jgi:hypothetical protein
VRDFRNIENRDAVLAYDRVEYVTDANGVPVTRWDGETMKPSPVTGEQIPDESARKPIERYVNPRKAAWPAADFVVGNPPFIGNKRMRTALGDGYVEALRGAWQDVPESADFVMYWWHHAAQLTRQGMLQRFGFITTNSIRQAFNRRVLEPHLSDKKQPLSLVFAIPDHPWVDTADGAAVRIAMTVATSGNQGATLREVVGEHEGAEEIEVTLHEKRGAMFADLKVGADVAGAQPLRANRTISNRGVIPHGEGFIVSHGEAARLGLGSVPDVDKHIRPYRNGRDISQTSRDVMVIDLLGLTADEVRSRFPEIFQHLLERVKPEREENKRASVRDKWWLFAEPRKVMRRAHEGLAKYIATIQTAKHRFFTFLDAEILPDDKLIAIASDDATVLGTLSSEVHVVWALAAGSRLGVGNDPVYNKSTCFECFPFPDLHAADKFAGPITYALEDEHGRPGECSTIGEYPSDCIRNLAEQLDAHRKRQQAAHPTLTLTGMYNVLDKLRSGEALTPKERTIHEQGLVSVLRQLHDELDAAVLAAYGWSDLLSLLRVAHGNDATAPLTPTLSPVGGGEGVEGTAISVGSVGGGEGAAITAKRAFDEAVLERLVALNAERAAEEARGQIRWLRPDFQNPSAATTPEQTTLNTAGGDDEAIAATPVTSKPVPWPKDTVEQVRAVADLLAASPAPLTVEQIAEHFSARGPWKKRLPPLLDMLVALGRAELRSDGSYEAGR